MVKLTTTRKTRFKAALILTGLTQGSWAEREGYARGYVNMVLNGKMESATLDAKIDAFIEDTESRRKVLVA
jgi:hypothetical protein